MKRKPSFNLLLFISTIVLVVGLLLLNPQRAFCGDHPEFVDFPVGPRAYEEDGQKGRQVRSISQWCCVRPYWRVGVFSEAPALSGLPAPREKIDHESIRGIIAVNTESGRTVWLRVGIDFSLVQSVFPLGEHCFGVVKKSKGKTALLKLQEVNILQKTVGEEREWGPINSIARAVDMSRVNLEWDPNSKWGLASSKVTLRYGQTKSKVTVPAPFQDYSLPNQMSALWEEGRETRWYAPAGDGIGVVYFQGRRPTEYESDSPYTHSSSLTCFAPRHPRGFRFQMTLPDIVGRKNVDCDSLLPLYSPWKNQPTLLVEYNTTRRMGIHGRSVLLARIDLRDGSVHRILEFEELEKFRFLVRLWWPQCSPDQSRIVYLVQSDRRAIGSLAVFSVAERRFLKELPWPCPFARQLLTVLPTEEAVVSDPCRIWAVGVGKDNYGKVRQICELFFEE